MAFTVISAISTISTNSKGQGPTNQERDTEMYS